MSLPAWPDNPSLWQKPLGMYERRKPVPDGFVADRPGSSPPKPFRLARQFHGLDLLEFDGALGHEIVEIAVCWTRDFRAIQVHRRRRAMILLGPRRGVAAPFHTCRNPVGFLIKALANVLAGGAAVLGGQVERLLHVKR